MSNKGGIIGGIITIAIGSTVYSVSQADVAKHFSKDTGMSQEQAQQYVESVKEEDLVPYDEMGEYFISDGQEILGVAKEIDCVNYEYEWETVTLTCNTAKTQLNRIGNNEISLGKAYAKLTSDAASKDDISLVISLIDKVNADLDLGVTKVFLDSSTIIETKKTNSYNKALLQAALESE